MVFTITILGSSSALPTSKRFPTAQVVNLRERFFLLDCGEGTQIQLRKNNIRLGRINHIFISHLHGDHIFGLFGLLSSFALLERKHDLFLYGPPKLQQMLNFQFNQLGYKLPYKVIFHALDYTGVCKIYEDDQVTVESFPLKHKVPCCGFLFREKPKPLNIRKEIIQQYKLSIKDILHIKNGGDYVDQDQNLIPNNELTCPPLRQRTYAYCTDTLYWPEIIPVVKGVDVLYHEATFLEDKKNRAKETFHSTALQAAQIARSASVKKLLLGHFSARYKNMEFFEEEARSIFPESYAVQDGDTYHIQPERIG